MIDPDSQYSPGEQDNPPAEQDGGGGQDHQYQVNEKGKRGRESQDQVKEQVRKKVREVMDSTMEHEEKRPKLNMLDHFGLFRK